jgi:hypothetical protein
MGLSKTFLKKEIEEALKALNENDQNYLIGRSEEDLLEKKKRLGDLISLYEDYSQKLDEKIKAASENVASENKTDNIQRERQIINERIHREYTDLLN